MKTFASKTRVPLISKIICEFIVAAVTSALSYSIERFVMVFNICFGLVFVFAFVTPAIMSALAYFYFTVKGHPWVRILREELRSDSELFKQKKYNVEMAQIVNDCPREKKQQRISPKSQSSKQLQEEYREEGEVDNMSKYFTI